MSKDYKTTRAFVTRFVNPLLRNVTHSSRGPFAMIRHVGRKSGKTYEIPIMVFRMEDGFIISLTYGPKVDWLRNLQAAPEGTLRWHKKDYVFQTPVFLDRERALRELPPLFRFVLSRNKDHQFVKLPDKPVA